MIVSDRSTSAESVSSLNYSLSCVYFTWLHSTGNVFWADLRKMLLYSVGLNKALLGSMSAFRHVSVDAEIMSALSAFDSSPSAHSLVLDFPTCSSSS